MSILNWGLLGTARINRSIIPPLRLSPRNTLRGVASRDLARAQKYADEWQIPQAYGSYEAMLDDPDIDVVYIPLPNRLHAEWVIAAAQAGKHVLCEKPLALSVEEIDAMSDAARAAGVVVAEAFMYRHHMRTLQLKKLVDKGAIGEVHTIRGAFTFPLNRPDDVRWNPELGGGSLWDVGCYPLSFARFMLGSEPEEVIGRQVLGDSGVDVSFAALLRFPGDVLVQFDSGFRTQFRMEMEIAGSDGRLFVPMAFKPERQSHIYLTNGNDELRIQVDGNLLYLDEIEDLTDAVIEGKAPRVSIEESRGNVAAIRALYASALNV